MMLRVVITAALGLALMGTVKHEHLLERAHIVGSCTTYAHGRDGTEWRRCSSGRISGRPNLKLNGCTDAGPRGDDVLWHCPARLVSQNARQ
jgi:hypothetical protein